MMTGHGKLNEWSVCYDNSTNYLGYIHDSHDVRIHVSESDALHLTDLLNQLVEALGDIADRHSVVTSIGEKSLCDLAYDELLALGQIVKDESGYPK